MDDFGGQNPGWAPPSPVTPPPPPAITPARSSVVVSVGPERQPRRARGWIAIGALAAVLAVGATAFAVLGDDDTAEGFSLTAASEAAREAQSISFEVRVEGDGDPIVIDTLLDVEAGAMSMRIDVGPELPGGVRAVVDIRGEAMYMESATFIEIGLPIDALWVRVPFDDLDEFGFGGLDDSAQNPFDVSALFDTAEEVNEIGESTINGEAVKEYEVVVGIDALVELIPGLAEGYEEYGDELPESITYRAFVTADNQLRRLIRTEVLAGEEIVTTITVDQLDPDVTIEVPDPADSVSFDELFSF